MDAAPQLIDDLVSPLLRLLEVLLRLLDGDLQKHVILLSIAERAIAHPVHRAQTEAERLAEDAAPFPTRGVNVRSIADASGIPRETVRRKVRELADAGWIVSDGQTLQLTPRAYRELAPARDALKLLAQRFHHIMQEHERAQAAQNDAGGAP